jgi:hypothetical protein
MARNPAFQKPIARYVSPHFPDRIFAEDFDSDNIPYKGITPGTPHPDQTKYPDFKLAHQEPLETGKTVRRYWINDRLNQDNYNFETAYPYYGNSQFPRVKRTYVIPRADYPLALPSVDPVNPNALFVSESQTRFDDRVLDNLYVLVTRVFDVVPEVADSQTGGTLTGYGWGLRYPDGDQTKAVLVWTFPMAKGQYSAAAELSSCPIAGYTTLKLIDQEASPVENDPNQLRVTRVYASLSGADIPALRARGSINVIPPEFRVSALTTQTKTRVALPTPPDVPSGNLLESAVAAEKTGSGVKTNTELDIASLPTLVGEQTGQWGVEDTEREIVDEGDPTAFGFGVKQSAVRPLGAGKAISEKVEYPSSPATLIDIKTDEVTGIQYEIKKSLVDPSSAVPAPGSNETVERQAIDKWHSIQIVSKLLTSSLPATETFPTVASFRFPPILQSIGIRWSKDSNFGAEVNVPPDWTDSDPKTFTVQASAAVSISGQVYTNTVEFKTGSLPARLTRTYHTSLPSAPGSVLSSPGAFGSVVLDFGNKSFGRTVRYGGGGIQGGIGRKAARFNFGPVIHSKPPLLTDTDTITENAESSTGTLPWGGAYPVANVTVTQDGIATLYLPTANIPSSGWYIIQYNVARFRFGIYTLETIEVFI